MAETAVEHKPLTKRTALEYLERQGKPATAKELAIDLDSWASTASELLERATAQGLVSRNEKERPRAYSLTDAGRERLEYFRSQDPPGEQPGQSGNPGPPPEKAAQSESSQFEDFKAAVRSQFDALREDMHDIFARLGIGRHGEESPAEELRKKLESLAKETEERLDVETVGSLYRARHRLRTGVLSAFSNQSEVKKEIADLEAKVGSEVAGKVKRLIEVEDGLEDEELYAEALRLREALDLPAAVVGEGEQAAEEDQW